MIFTLCLFKVVFALHLHDGVAILVLHLDGSFVRSGNGFA